MTFTKGPWTIGNDGYNANTVYAGYAGVCQVYGVPMNARVDDVGERYAAGMANARLISAAPDMYEALADLLSSLEVVWSKGFAAREDLEPEIKFARAALSKAEGEA